VSVSEINIQQKTACPRFLDEETALFEFVQFIQIEIMFG